MGISPEPTKSKSKEVTMGLLCTNYNQTLLQAAIRMAIDFQKTYCTAVLLPPFATGTSEWMSMVKSYHNTTKLLMLHRGKDFNKSGEAAEQISPVSERHLTV